MYEYEKKNVEDITLNNLDKDDIELIIQQTGCSRPVVIQTYITCHHDLVNTIMTLTN
jgi:NACalpha-BTF3-like transcription factor